MSLNYKIKFNFKKIEEECQSVAVKILTLYNMLPDLFFFYLEKDSLFITYVRSEVQSKIRRACSILQIFAAIS